MIQTKGFVVSAGVVLAAGAALGDCPDWRALGEGLGGECLALGTYRGELIAGGRFTTAGGEPAPRLAAWDGAGWRALDGSIDEAVRALTEFDGNLVIGGDFVVAGGQAARQIAMWDGSAWSPVGGGVDNSVWSLGTHDFGNGPELLVGGQFGSVGGIGGIRMNFFASWTGSNWRSPGSVNGVVRAIGRYRGDLVIGGDFTLAGGQVVNHVAIWDGSSWQGLAGGVSGSGATVWALAEYEGELIVGGRFQSAGGFLTEGLAAWDGSGWRVLDQGVGGGIVQTVVHALAVHGGELYVGGEFTTAGGEPADRAARWDGARWHALGEGLSHTANALAVFGEDVVAGGMFATAGGEPASRVAAWGCAQDPCYPDCDGDGRLDFFDFLCFQNAFLAGDPYADCDQNGVLDFFDFLCFQNEFLAGC